MFSAVIGKKTALTYEHPDGRGNVTQAPADARLSNARTRDRAALVVR